MDFSALMDLSAKKGSGRERSSGARARRLSAGLSLRARHACRAVREARVRTARSGHLTPMPSADPQSVRGSGVPSDAWAAVAKPVRGSGGIEFGGDLLSIVEDAGPPAGLGMAPASSAQ